MRLRYVTGPAYAVVRSGAVVMLTEKVSPELVDELWRALDGEPGVVPLLEVLTGSFGASLASLPPFAIAVADDARVHVAVRGGTSVNVGTATGERVAVTGESVTTWAERTLDDVAELAVHAGRVGTAGDLVDGGLPLDGGVVLASSVGVVLAERPRAAAAAPAPAAVAPAQAAVAPAQAVVVPAQAAVAPAWGEPVAEAPAAEVAVADVPADDQPADGMPAGEPLAVGADLASASSVDAPGVEVAPASRSGASPGTTPGAVARAAAVPVASVPLTAGEAPAAPEDGVSTEVSVGPQFESAPVAVSDAASVEAEAFEETSGYGHLWGSTVHRGVEAAAVRPEEEEGEDEASESGDPAPTAERAPDAEPPGEPSAELAAGEVIPLETIAPETVAPETVASETVAPGDDDVDGSTVLSSAIADLRAAATPAAAAASLGAPGPAFAPASAPGRPMILARTCPGGHPNPPQRDDCSVCGQALAGEARQVPRPPLGVMAVSSGPRISLDRPVVVGRRPRSPRSAGDDLPRLVTVPSPEQDISRSHVEVRLEGWHVLVSDMSTTNGTTLLRPGQAPMRLHPGEPVLVVSSDVVDLGDGVTLTFEGIV